MSIEAVHWALNVPIGGSAKVILLGLANHAHPDGTESYPALDTLAKYGNCDRSTARRNVRRLVIEGWVSQDGTGPRGQRKFRLHLDRHTGLQNATPGVALAPAGGGTDATPGVAPMPPEPPINHPEPEQQNAGEDPTPSPVFDDKRLSETLAILETAPRLVFDMERMGVANMLNAYPAGDHTKAAHIVVARAADPAYNTTNAARALQFAFNDLERQSKPTNGRPTAIRPQAPRGSFAGDLSRFDKSEV